VLGNALDARAIEVEVEGHATEVILSRRSAISISEAVAVSIGPESAQR
jgi:hypothetical protein